MRSLIIQQSLRMKFVDPFAHLEFVVELQHGISYSQFLCVDVCLRYNEDLPALLDRVRCRQKGTQGDTCSNVVLRKKSGAAKRIRRLVYCKFVHVTCNPDILKPRSVTQFHIVGG